jgi:hypothetical protein
MAAASERSGSEMDDQPRNSARLRTDPATGLPLPDPYPEYVSCPHCGEAEVEVYCYQLSVTCHNCGGTIAHIPPPLCGTYPYCKRAEPPEDGGQEP